MSRPLLHRNLRFLVLNAQRTNARVALAIPLAKGKEVDVLQLLAIATPLLWLTEFCHVASPQHS
jgi:hypothetical protein